MIGRKLDSEAIERAVREGSGSAGPQGGPSGRLGAIYGDRLKITTGRPHAARYLSEIAKFPDPIHRKLSAHLSEKPDGGIYIGDGPVTSITPGMKKKKGVVPRGWEKSGRTWDDVPGAFDTVNRQVVLGDEGSHSHDAGSLALHETAHGIDDALGRISATKRWTDIAGYAVGATRHPYLTHKHNPTGLWSEAFAEGYAGWVDAVSKGEDPIDGVAKALYVSDFYRETVPEVAESLANIVTLFEGISS